MWVWGLVVAAWAGLPSLNEVLSAEERILVGPFPEPLQRLADRFGGVVEADRTARPAEGVVVLYGDRESNPLLADVLERHRIRLFEDHVVLGQHDLPIPEPFVIAALPEPGVADAVVYTAFDSAVQPHLNQVFHGPTAIVVGSSRGDSLSVRYSGRFQTDGDGRLTGLELAPSMLTGEQLAEDVQAVHERLVFGYGGLLALREAMGARGTSWADWVAQHHAEALASPSWSFPEAWDLIVRLLDPIDDVHFGIRGNSLDRDRLPQAHQASTVVPWRVWFADPRLRKTSRGWQVGDQELAEVPPVVPAPSRAQVGVAYRFPTRLADGSDAFLLGVFAHAGDRPGALQWDGREWPLHRPARVVPTQAWQRSGGRDALLEVRTMTMRQLDGMADTADRLRRSRTVILDLRGNGGGSDRPALDWVTGFSGQRYRWHGSTDVQPGPGPQLGRMSLDPPRWIERAGPRKRYRGALFVLVDGAVASSGETFAMLASQVEGALRVGTNTAGCTDVGNVTEQEPLPHTRIGLRFGRTAFHFDDVVPIAEGRGMFPDLWLDELDPVGFLREMVR